MATLLGICTANGIADAQNIWLSRAEIGALPMAGAAWRQLKDAADAPAGAPNLSDQNERNNALVLAKALVYARTREPRYRSQVVDQCRAAIGTERGGRTLSLGRKLCAYVVAADLVQYENRQFSDWLRTCLTETLDGDTLVDTHEKRPNNWGTHAGASRLAVALYLNDRPQVERCAAVFRGWTGDRAAYAGFRFVRDLSWCDDPLHPVAVDPPGAMKQGLLIDGALPEEMRRGGVFQVPPMPTGYPWEALQGAIVQAELLHRHGCQAYQWQNQAILRAVQFLYRVGWEPVGDDQWLIWIINRRYGTKFPTVPTPSPGKNLGWTNWTHGWLPQPSP